MSSNAWQTYKLGDIIDDIAMGPFGSNIKVDNFIPSGVPVIRGMNLNLDGFNDDKFVFVSEEKALSLRRSLAYPDDLVFTHRGTIGQVGIIPRNKYDKYLVSQSQLKLTVNKKLLDPYFLYYFFLSPIGQYELLKNSSQVGVPAIASPTTSLKGVNIPLPPLATQQRIAAILSALDEKIALNRQLNATLEAIAQALFKQWFVDFNYPGATGEMQDSVLGKIPVGWRVGTLGEISSNYDKQRIPLSSRERDTRKGVYPYYGAAGIVDYINDYIFDGIYLLMGEDGSVINDQGYPILQYIRDKFWVNNHAHVLQGKDVFSTEFIYCILSNTNVKHIVTGAVQPKINQQNMNNLSVLIPVEQILRTFQSIIHPLFHYILDLRYQSQNIAEIRDKLLPKLMRGEIVV